MRLLVALGVCGDRAWRSCCVRVDELLTEECDGGRCIVARDAKSGSVLWTRPTKSDLPEVVYGDDRSLYIATSASDRFVFEIRRRDTGESVGRWPE
jgi:hypothetical protein